MSELAPGEGVADLMDEPGFDAAMDGDPVDLLDLVGRGLFGFNSRDARSRPFNLLRSQVMKAAKANGWKIIGVTSATPDVGKSFIASNLAASMARIPERQTLLFDLDLRRSSIAKRFGIEDGPGLGDYLAGSIASLDSVGRRISNTALTVFPAHMGAPNSSEALAGSRMQRLVAAMRRLPESCFCLCDLPPAFANDDASIVLQQIDAYLLVIDQGKTSKKHVLEAIDLLKPAPCMGTVLNRYRGPIGGDDYGFGYWSRGYYKAYYSNG